MTVNGVGNATDCKGQAVLVEICRWILLAEI